MTITGINTQGVYCPDMGDIRISGLSSDDIIVEFTIIYNGMTKSTSWTERYTPLENEVRIKNLGDVAFDFFAAYPFELYYGPREVGTNFFYYVTLQGIIKKSDGQELGNFEQKFFYSTQKTGVAPMANNRFLNRFSQRMVRPDQFIFVAFPTQLQALKLGVAYKDSEERVQYTIVEWPREANNPSWNRSRNLSPLVVAIRLSEVIEETISVDNLLYYEASLYLQDGTLADRIRFNMDFKHYKQLTHLVFYNLFGMPETLYFTGMDESTSEIEGTYALMAGQYSKIKTEMHDVHVINSGYINASTLDSIKDMICSKEVYLYHGTTRQAITILDAELVTTKPRNAPTNVRITYRLADEKSTVFGRPDLDNTNVFDDIFDYTFN